MLYAFLGLCALIGATALCRFLIARIRALDCNIRELEARRLLGANEVENLKEENAIMRNLLLDIIENETSLANCNSAAERTLRSKQRTVRRRELFGEAVVLLDKSAAPKIRIPQLTH